MKLHQLALVVEPNPLTAEQLRGGLGGAGFEVMATERGADGVSAIGLRHPDIVLANLVLPDMPGTELRRILESGETTVDLPLILFQPCPGDSGRPHEFLIAPGGMNCPIGLHQLALRASALARPRAARLSGDRLHSGPLRVDTGAHRAFVGEQEVALTAIEFRLLVTLMSTTGRVLGRDQLLRDVWGVRGRGDTRTIDTHIKRLRRKLGTAGAFIETVRNVGYRFGTSTDVERGTAPGGGGQYLHITATASAVTPLEASSNTGERPREEAS